MEGYGYEVLVVIGEWKGDGEEVGADVRHGKGYV